MSGRKIRKLSLIFSYHMFFLFCATYISVVLYRAFVAEHFTSFVLDISFLVFFTVVYLVLMWNDLYKYSHHYYLRPTYRFVVKNLLCSVIFIGALFFVFIVSGKRSEAGWAGQEQLSEILYFLSIAVVTLILLHFLQYAWMRYLSKLGYFQKNVVIIGNPDERLPIDELFQDIGRTKKYTAKIEWKNGRWDYILLKKEGHTGSDKDINSILYRSHAGEVIIFIDDVIPADKIHEISSFCRNNSICYSLVTDIHKLTHKYPWNKRFKYIPIIERFSTKRESLTKISIKRLMDIVFAAGALVISMPLFLIVSILIKLEDRGPIVYRSKRIGKNGMSIKFYKFRSMVKDAEILKQRLLKYNERRDGPLFEMRNDPRITHIGRLIRKLSIDEFPQFLSVLKGDMSLIGPRPHLPEEVEEYSDRDLLRLECMPGISCLPQVVGRNDLSFREWIEYDLEYRKKWSLMLDIHIVGKTLRTIIQPLLDLSFKNSGVY